MKTMVSIFKHWYLSAIGNNRYPGCTTRTSVPFATQLQKAKVSTHPTPYPAQLQKAKVTTHPTPPPNPPPTKSKIVYKSKSSTKSKISIKNQNQKKTTK